MQAPQPAQAADQLLEALATSLRQKPDLAGTVGRALRQSFDEVIDGPRTGRYRIEQLEKTEKTYIGTKVEIVLRNDLELGRGGTLDCSVGGCEFDIKFSLTGGWMIPREAVGQVCLLVAGNDNSGEFSVGLLRMMDDVLTTGANQDGKRSVSAAGKQDIVWLVHNAALPRNFLLDLDDAERERIMSRSSGMQRVRELFTLVTGRIIPRTAIEQVAQQRDPMRRARQMKNILAEEGIQVLCATYEADRAEFRRHGFADFKDDDWLSIRL